METHVAGSGKRQQVALRPEFMIIPSVVAPSISPTLLQTTNVFGLPCVSISCFNCLFMPYVKYFALPCSRKVLIQTNLPCLGGDSPCQTSSVSFDSPFFSTRGATGNMTIPADQLTQHWTRYISCFCSCCKSCLSSDCDYCKQPDAAGHFSILPGV